MTDAIYGCNGCRTTAGRDAVERVAEALRPYADSPFDQVAIEDHEVVWALIPDILRAIEAAHPEGLDVERLAREAGRAQAEQEAVKVLARIVAAAGGEVRVPDRLVMLDVSMATDWERGETVYRARLSATPTPETPDE